MTKNIFLNLPVKDLKKSMDFYSKLGFTNNPQFTDDTAACMVISENIYVMLLTYDKFKAFTKKDIADATKTTQILLAIDAESKEKLRQLLLLGDLVKFAKEQPLPAENEMSLTNAYDFITGTKREEEMIPPVNQAPTNNA